ncbi:hypothetical protein ACJX0J_036254 [Zea mays]
MSTILVHLFVFYCTKISFWLAMWTFHILKFGTKIYRKPNRKIHPNIPSFETKEIILIWKIVIFFLLRLILADLKNERTLHHHLLLPSGTPCLQEILALNLDRLDGFALVPYYCIWCQLLHVDFLSSCPDSCHMNEVENLSAVWHRSRGATLHLDLHVLFKFFKGTLVINYSQQRLSLCCCINFTSDIPIMPLSRPAHLTKHNMTMTGSG